MPLSINDTDKNTFFKVLLNVENWVKHPLLFLVLEEERKFFLSLPAFSQPFNKAIFPLSSPASLCLSLVVHLKLRYFDDGRENVILLLLQELFHSIKRRRKAVHVNGKIFSSATLL
jgi:hypothetical protein